MSGLSHGGGIFVAGRTYVPGQRDYDNSINRVVIAPAFFATMEIPLAAGRGFTGHDTATSQKVVIINETAARKYFPNQNPIGQRFGQSIETSGQLEIVGVLRDVKYNDLREPPPATMYVPLEQTRSFGTMFEVRTAGNPVAAMGAIREAVRQVDPNLPLMDMSTQMEQIERRFLQEKLFAQAYALFGGLAVRLAAIGLFGLMSYSVLRQRSGPGS